VIDAATLVYGVLGNPVAHSLSPLMHNRAFAAAGLKAVYVAFPTSDIADAVAGIRALGIRGASVTIPHKVAVMGCLDACDPVAEAVGAANTIVKHGGRLKGYNTDAAGAVQALEEATALPGRSAAVVGAGGVARAIGYGLRRAGVKVVIVNRSHGPGEALARHLGADFLPLADLERGVFDILVNATPVGMAPGVEASPVPSRCLHRGMTVMDAVYTPLETRLLRNARTRGCATVDGVSLFVRQGVLQFELWTGLAAPMAEMNRVVRSVAARPQTAD
jgi:shikimate dehydrogenase